MSVGNLNELSLQMRSDWNRRVRHDYRFWLAEGFASDDEMWRSGERDLKRIIATSEAKDLVAKRALEIGCGIGRLTKPASDTFGHTTAVDISSEAIEKAKEFLSNTQKVTFIEGDGVSLAAVASASVDFVFSFATLSSLPAHALINYLPEINRVLVDSGIARLQLHIGYTATESEVDTLIIRAYAKEALTAAFELCGFSVSEIIALPHEVCDEGNEYQAVIFDLRKTKSATEVRTKDLENILVPQTRHKTENGETEYRRSVAYAESLIDRGDFTKAKETVEYAARFLDTIAIDLRDIFERVHTKLEQTKRVVRQSEQGVFEANLAVLHERFPQVALQMQTLVSVGEGIEVRATSEGPAIFEKGVALDHNTKPKSSAIAWARSALPRGEKDFLIVGFGLGYHVEQILAERKVEHRYFVIEPNPQVLRIALETRDLRDVISKLHWIACAVSELPPITNSSALVIRSQTQVLHSEFVAEVKTQILSERALTQLRPSIAVAGPRHGGTLPMLGYLSNGLSLMNQRVRPYDFSVFDSGYTHIESLLKQKARQQHASVHFTEAISDVALHALMEKPVDILITLPFAPISPRVLDELRNQGVITVLWFVEDYQRFDMWKALAKHYDFVFTIQKGAAIEAIKNAGAGHVSYLPVGCDPMIHAPQALTEEERRRYGSPISFMGSGYHNRQQLFASLSELPLKIWGTEWPTCRPFDKLVQEEGRRLTPVEYVKVFSGSEINLNLHSSGERDGVDPFGDFVNPRTFELAAAGAFQLVDNRALLSESFEIGKELITFSDGFDLKDKIKYYLAHPEEARVIAARARERALKDHSYITRLRSMFRTIFSQRYGVLSNRLAASPWVKMKERAATHSELSDRCERAWLRGEEPTLDGLVSDIVVGKGKLSPTEQRLMFLYHIKRSTIRMREEELGMKPKGDV